MALNHGWAYRSQVGPDAAGRTVLAHLALAYQHSDRGTWTTRLAAGEVMVDGQTVAGHEVLRAGQLLVWQRPPWNEPDVPLAFEIVHDDTSVVAVNKPAGLPTMPSGGFLEHTLWHLVRRRYPDAAPVHRLGRFTSGLVLCARTRDAAAALSREWREQRVEKWYRALASGHPPWSSLDVTVPIGPVPHARLGQVYAASATGRPAHSYVEVRAPRADDTLVDIRITTGRPHQIRIHLAAAGHPLAGDPLYVTGGLPRGVAPALPGNGGYHLHAHRVRLAHPASGALLQLEAPLPAQLV